MENSLFLLSRELSQNILDYVGAESEATKEALIFLEAILEAAERKIANSRPTALRLTAYTEKCVQKYREREKVLGEIEKVDEEITDLEILAQHLDEYTARLETSFAKLR